MFLSLLVQVVLPLGLILWLGFAPVKSLTGYVVQAVCGEFLHKSKENPSLVMVASIDTIVA